MWPSSCRCRTALGIADGPCETSQPSHTILVTDDVCRCSNVLLLRLQVLGCHASLSPIHFCTEPVSRPIFCSLNTFRVLLPSCRSCNRLPPRSRLQGKAKLTRNRPLATILSSRRRQQTTQAMNRDPDHNPVEGGGRIKGRDRRKAKLRPATPQHSQWPPFKNKTNHNCNDDRG